MNTESLKEIFLIVTPFIVTLGGIISALFVKIYNAKHNLKALKEEIAKITEANAKEREKTAEALAARDAVIRELKDKLAEAMTTIDLLRSKVDTKNGSPYISKLETVNNEYANKLQELQKVLNDKTAENNKLLSQLKEIKSNFSALTNKFNFEEIKQEQPVADNPELDKFLDPKKVLEATKKAMEEAKAVNTQEAPKNESVKATLY